MRNQSAAGILSFQDVSGVPVKKYWIYLLKAGLSWGRFCTKISKLMSKYRENHYDKASFINKPSSF
jgi:hypothetical protein